MKKIALLCSLPLLLLACKKKEAPKPTPKPSPAAAKPAAAAQPTPTPAPKPTTGKVKRAVLETTLGEIEIEFYKAKSPKGYENFIAYANSGAYAGTVFHRVKPGFMIQGGGFDKDLKRRPTRAPLKNEADNGLANDRGTVAWARTPHPHSATNQFFINVANNDFLNHKAKNYAGWGYAVFAKVVRGMKVADKISRVKTAPKGMHQLAPVTPVVINKVRLVE